MNILKNVTVTVLLLSSLLAAQTNEGTKASDSEIRDLKQQLADQQKQIDELRRALEEQRRLIAGGMSGAAHPIQDAPPVKPAEAAVPVIASRGESASKPSQRAGQLEPEESPLQLRIGSAYITPLGFLDFTSVWRNHDGGSGIGTNFGGIPYGDVFQNHLSELRLSIQNSRVGFRVDAMVKGAHVIGYMESDFLGNNPANVAVSSNSNTLRSRLFWVDLQKKKWEVLGGQTWSLITPGRSGISPLPANLFYTQNVDVNYQAGFVWGRIPELRLTYRPTAKTALAIALDSPEQYIGGSAGGGTVTFPAALAPVYANPLGASAELNNGNTLFNAPNVAPDFIGKFAIDPSSKFHAEIGGLQRTFKLWNPITHRTFTAAGGGAFLNANLELLKGLRLVTNNFWSDGGGRYIFGQVPDLVARSDGRPSLVHSGSTLSGFEYTRGNTLLYSYYGGVYAQRNVTIDNNGTRVGYGYSGAPPGQNRTIQEATAGFIETFWRDPRYGALQLWGQYSYLQRDPWFVAPSQPRQADMQMVFLNLRYALPGSAPAMQ